MHPAQCECLDLAKRGERGGVDGMEPAGLGVRGEPGGGNVLNSPDLPWVEVDVLKAVTGPEYPQTLHAELNRVSKSYHLGLCLSVSNKLKF